MNKDIRNLPADYKTHIFNMFGWMWYEINQMCGDGSATFYAKSYNIKHLLEFFEEYRDASKKFYGWKVSMTYAMDPDDPSRCLIEDLISFTVTNGQESLHVTRKDTGFSTEQCLVVL